MERVMTVRGMTCEHCRKTVTGVLEGLGGVSDVDVDLASGLVRVVYDEKKVTEAQMREAVEEAGYDVD